MGVFSLGGRCLSNSNSLHMLLLSTPPTILSYIIFWDRINIKAVIILSSTE